MGRADEARRLARGIKNGDARTVELASLEASLAMLEAIEALSKQVQELTKELKRRP